MSFYVKNGDGGDGIERGEEEVRTSVIYGWSCTFDRMSMRSEERRVGKECPV